ncbi:hypothetical protein [Planotetraspora silvatica]|uniref:hypothetical protein n=1 Tax=Planotetraspora silvatica TaxID=234614 RepID=UPI00194F0FD9|nr:hypothetical protein [Planotetraspora silvatica]
MVATWSASSPTIVPAVVSMLPPIHAPPSRLDLESGPTGLAWATGDQGLWRVPSGATAAFLL